jgi:hypothetical protein
MPVSCRHNGSHHSGSATTYYYNTAHLYPFNCPNIIQFLPEQEVP